MFQVFKNNNRNTFWLLVALISNLMFVENLSLSAIKFLLSYKIYLMKKYYKRPY